MESWTSYVASFIWAPSPSSEPQPLPELDVSVAVLQRAKANLRPTKTRVAPERYPSRIPFIEEMHQLATKFREQQRAMRLEQ